MHSLVPRNNKLLLTSNGSSGCRSSWLNNGSDRYSLTHVFVSLDPGSMVDIAPTKLVFCTTLLSSSLEYSLDSSIVVFCLESPSATKLDFPQIGRMSKSNMEIRSNQRSCLGVRNSCVSRYFQG